MMHNLKRIAALGLLAVCLPGGAGAADSPSQLYDRMRDAVRHTDYEGRFVYQVGDRLDAMYVVHRVKGGHELERLVALNGVPKEVIRGTHAVACLDPHRRKISVVGSGESLADVPVVNTEELGKQYRFELGRELRVAGRPARELLIQPLDELRFGYRIALDRETALPLQSVMLDGARRVRSQTLFVDLKTGDGVTPIERDLSALQLADRPATEIMQGSHDAAIPAPSVELNDLPRGFRLIRVLSPEPGVQHLLLTDGLASVSLYIEPVDEQGFDGFSRIGSMELFGKSLQDVQITVVGEVPRQTLKLIANGVRIQ